MDQHHHKPLLVEHVYEIDDSEEDCPRMISQELFSTLNEYVLSLMPSERNVLFTMKEYDMCSLYPAYNELKKKDKDRPTHVIIYSFRVINNDVFQPVGGTFVYDDFDVSDVVAECIKAFINDLWKLGLYVVGSVSPPSNTFKQIMKHIVDIADLDNYTGILSYSVHPFKDIIHVYDLQILERALISKFETCMISFQQPNIDNEKELNIVVAAWADVLTALNAHEELEMLAKALNTDAIMPKNVNLFTEHMLLKLMELLVKGYDVAGTLILVHCFYSFLTEVETDFAVKKSSDWAWIMKSLRVVLKTMLFKKDLSDQVPEGNSLDTPEKDTKPPDYKNEQKTEQVLQTNNESQNCDKDGNNNGLEEGIERLVEVKSLTGSPFLTLLPSLLSAECTIEVINRKLYVKENTSGKISSPSEIQNIIDTMRIQRNYERLRISDDLICSVEGINRLLGNFQKRRLKGAKVNLFNVEHLDDFIGKVKEKNGLLSIPKLKGCTYNLLNEGLAFTCMKSSHSLYSIHKVPPLDQDNTEAKTARKKKKKRPKTKGKEQDVAGSKEEG